jgi:hypothetical protein
MSLKFLPLLLALASTALDISQSTPPWSKGENDPAGQQGYAFLVPDVDNVPDLQGNPSDAKLVIFIGVRSQRPAFAASKLLRRGFNLTWAKAQK